MDTFVGGASLAESETGPIRFLYEIHAYKSINILYATDPTDRKDAWLPVVMALLIGPLSRVTLKLRLALKSDGTAFSFSTRLLHSLLKQSLVKCWEQMLLYFVGLKLFLLMAATHFPQTSGRANGNLAVRDDKHHVQPIAGHVSVLPSGKQMF